MLSKHLILCHPILLPASIFPSIRVFYNESVLCISWPKYWTFSFSISPSSEYSELISLGWTGLISLQSKGLSRVFSNITVQKHQFFGAAWSGHPVWRLYFQKQGEAIKRLVMRPVRRWCVFSSQAYAAMTAGTRGPQCLLFLSRLCHTPRSLGTGCEKGQDPDLALQVPTPTHTLPFGKTAGRHAVLQLQREDYSKPYSALLHVFGFVVKWHVIYTPVMLPIYRCILALDTASFWARTEKIEMGELLLNSFWWCVWDQPVYFQPGDLCSGFSGLSWMK